MMRETGDKNNKIGINIFFFFLFIYLFFMSGHMGGDSFAVYLTTESIILDGNLVLNDHPEREFGIQEMKGNYNAIKTSKEEKIYSKYQLGEVILQIPFFLIGYLITLLYNGIHSDYITMFFTSMTNCFITALLCFVFYKLLKLFSISDKISILVTIALGLGTFIFPFSRQGFREPLTGLCILIGTYYIIKYKMFYLKKYLLFAGIAIGWSCFTRIDSVYVLPPFLLYILFTGDKKRFVSKITYFFSPIILLVIIHLIINYSITKDFIEFGYGPGYFKNVSFSPIDILINIYGFFLSSGRSVFLYAPVTILFFLTISKFIRAYKGEGIFFLAIIIFNFFLYFSFKSYFMGGYCWGPRFQYAIIPFFLVPTIYYLQDSKIKHYIFIVLLILGILIQLPSVLVNSSMVQHKIFEYFNNKAELCEGLPFRGIEIQSFMPQFSPIVLGYYHIVSTINSSIGRDSVKIPAARYWGKDKGFISFELIDFWDIWFFNVFRIVKGNLIIKILTIISIIIQVSLIFKIGFSFKLSDSDI